MWLLKENDFLYSVWISNAKLFLLENLKKSVAKLYNANPPYKEENTEKI